jgi:glycosyltransferase involved in cell wall biosynthesis
VKQRDPVPRDGLHHADEPYPAGRGTDIARPLPRVLYAADLEGSTKFGSLEEQTFLLAQEFRRQGSLLLPLFRGPAGPTPFTDAGLEIEYLDLTRFRRAHLRRLLHVIDRQGIAAVHWHFYPPMTNPYVWWLSLLRPRLCHYYTDHNSRLGPTPVRPGFLKRRLKSTLLRRYRKVVCVSRFVRDWQAGEGGGRHLVLVPHFVNSERFVPDPAVQAGLRPRLAAGAGHFVLLVIAQLIVAKGIDVVLRALTELPDDVVLWVVGAGPEDGSLARLAGDLGVTGRVRWLGLQVDVRPYLQAADCFVCPSRWYEAAGLVNLEAQAVGLPVVASRIGGIPEYVVDGETGMLFTPGDSRELAGHVRRLKDEPAACRTMGEAGRRNVAAHFSPAWCLAAHVDIYRP